MSKMKIGHIQFKNMKIIMISEGRGYIPNTSLDWDSPLIRGAFYNDGFTPLPKGFSGEVEEVWQLRSTTWHSWVAADKSDYVKFSTFAEFNKYYKMQGYCLTRQIYLSPLPAPESKEVAPVDYRMYEYYEQPTGKWWPCNMDISAFKMQGIEIRSKPGSPLEAGEKLLNEQKTNPAPQKLKEPAIDEGVNLNDMSKAYATINSDTHFENQFHWQERAILGKGFKDGYTAALSSKTKQVEWMGIERVFKERIKSHNVSTIRNPTAQQVNLNMLLKQECNFLLNQIRNLIKST